MRHHILFLLIILAFGATGRGAIPADYTFTRLAGSAMPYPSEPTTASKPDSLTPVMINHVGRHGARFPTGPESAEIVSRMLLGAYDGGTLTPAGESLLALADSVREVASGRWGQLSPLGRCEQRDLAARMFMDFPSLFGRDAAITAIASPKPRCISSMNSFIHELTLLNKGGLRITTQSGTPEADSLLRFFSCNHQYRSLIVGDTLQKIARAYEEQLLPDSVVASILTRLTGTPPTKGEKDNLNLANAVYALIAGCGAMGMEVDPGQWLSREDYARLWAYKNYSQYLRYSANPFTTLPATMAAPLLSDIIGSTDRFIADSTHNAPVILRFGHAETLMPLLSLMGVPGAYFPDATPGEVTEEWHNFYLVPMAANVRLILFRGPDDALYGRVDLNEQPVKLLPGDDRVYIPWPELRAYLVSRLNSGSI